MDGMPGTTRLGISGSVLQEEPTVSRSPEYPHFVIPDKPPPSYEESQQQQAAANSEASEVSQPDKLAIYRHPLFPLLAMLFDKCEQATNTNEGPSSQAFQNDIRSFLLHLGQDGKSLISGNEETDNLMVKAILVLKVHLLEIEKVNELCKDFCQRYIACLKGKLQTDNMLRGIYTSGLEDFTGNGTFAIQNDPTIEENQDMPNLAFLSQSLPTVGSSSLGNNDVKTLTEQVSPLVYSPQIQQAVTLNSNAQENTAGIASSTSNFGSPQVIDTQYISPVSGTPNQSPMAATPIVLPTRKSSRRGVLPKAATNIMKAWLFQHIAHPYPSEEEKRVISNQTNLTLLQVNNWFINARRRILQPMLDSSNTELIIKSRRPKAIQSRSAQRFWPESLVQTIQGTSSTIQFPAQTIHVISTDIKDGLHPIPIVSNTHAPSSTGVHILSVESRPSKKLTPILATLTSSLVPQPILPKIVNDSITSIKESILSPTDTNIHLAVEPDCTVTNSDFPSVSELHVTASQVSTHFT